jgi:hypothetical protein
LAPGGSNSALYARRTCACENACVRALVGAWWAGEQLFFAATAACSTYLVRFDTLAAELRSTCHSSKIHDVVFPVPPPPPPPPRTRAGQHWPATSWWQEDARESSRAASKRGAEKKRGSRRVRAPRLLGFKPRGASSSRPAKPGSSAYPVQARAGGVSDRRGERSRRAARQQSASVRLGSCSAVVSGSSSTRVVLVSESFSTGAGQVGYSEPKPPGLVTPLFSRPCNSSLLPAL